MQAIEDGGEGDSYVVNVNLEIGTYRVSHGKSLAHLASAEGPCTAKEVDVGRRLFTLERVEGYAADASSGERTLKFTVLWPDGFPKSKTVFALDALAPGVAGAEAAAYTQDWRYARRELRLGSHSLRRGGHHRVQNASSDGRWSSGAW